MSSRMPRVRSASTRCIRMRPAIEQLSRPTDSCAKITENQRLEQKHAWNSEAWADGAVADSAAAGDAAAFGCIFCMPPLCCTHARLHACALCRALLSPGQRVASLRRTRRRL